MENKTYFYLIGICGLSGDPMVIASQHEVKDDNWLELQVVDNFAGRDIEELKILGHKIEMKNKQDTFDKLKMELGNE